MISANISLGFIFVYLDCERILVKDSSQNTGLKAVNFVVTKKGENNL